MYPIFNDPGYDDKYPKLYDDKVATILDTLADPVKADCAAPHITTTSIPKTSRESFLDRFEWFLASAREINVGPTCYQGFAINSGNNTSTTIINQATKTAAEIQCTKEANAAAVCLVVGLVLGAAGLVQSYFIGKSWGLRQEAEKGLKNVSSLKKYYR